MNKTSKSTFKGKLRVGVAAQITIVNFYALNIKCFRIILYLCITGLYLVYHFISKYTRWSTNNMTGTEQNNPNLQLYNKVVISLIKVSIDVFL